MNVFLKPAAIPSPDDPAVLVPAIVRDPSTRKPLDPAGEWKAMTTFWQRRLRDGDVKTSPAVTPPRAVAADPVAIPEDWRSLHHTQRVKLAEALEGDFTVPDGMTRTQAADATIAAEVERRSAR